MIKAPTPQEIEEAVRPFEGTFYDGPDDPVRAYSEKYRKAQDAEIVAAGGLEAWRQQHSQTQTHHRLPNPKPATMS
jgi:hypothetical protein